MQQCAGSVMVHCGKEADVIICKIGTMRWFRHAGIWKNAANNAAGCAKMPASRLPVVDISNATACRKLWSSLGSAALRCVDPL